MNYRRLLKHTVLLFILLQAHSFSCIASETFNISAIEDSPYTRIFTRVLKKAYHELGIDIVIHEYPAERSKRVSLTGDVDGELHRIKGFQKSGEMVIVPTPILSADIVAIGKNTIKNFKGIESLKHFKVGIRRGMRLLERIAVGHDVERINTHEQLYDMIKKGRIDLMLIPYFSAIQLQQKLGVGDKQILSPPVISVDVFHYLNKKHKTLIPKLNRILQRLKKNGTINKIMAEEIEHIQHSTQNSKGLYNLWKK